MKNQNDNCLQSNLWVGLLVLSIGLILLLDRMNVVDFPFWLISWPMILIVIGVFIGVKKKFQGISWLVLILLGSFFMLGKFPEYSHLKQYGIPAGVIAVGLLLVLRATILKPAYKPKYWDDNWRKGSAKQSSAVFGAAEESTSTDDEYIDISTIMGGIQKKVLSKNFKGGQCTNIFGGTDLDFNQADIQGVAVLDVTQLFGGIVLRVPANWNIKSDLTSIFAGVEDKRKNVVHDEANGKTLVLKGTSIFAGVEIKNH